MSHKMLVNRTIDLMTYQTWDGSDKCDYKMFHLNLKFQNGWFDDSYGNVSSITKIDWIRYIDGYVIWFPKRFP